MKVEAVIPNLFRDKLVVSGHQSARALPWAARIPALSRNKFGMTKDRLGADGPAR
jgi:hypothetical protein